MEKAELDQHQPGAKLDDGKVDLTYNAEYFPLAIEEVCRIAMFAEKKYVRGGWCTVPAGAGC